MPSNAAIRALRTVASETSDLSIRLAALLCESAMAYRTVDRLRLSVSEISDVTFLIRSCSEILRWGTVNDSDIREMQYRCNIPERFDEVVLLAAALSDGDPKVMEISLRSKVMMEDGTAMFGYKLPVSGKDIINELGLTPGPMIKECQEYLLSLAFKNPRLTQSEALEALMNRNNNG